MSKITIFRGIWMTVMASLFSGCVHGSGPRLLTVGGIHVFEREAPCKLERIRPADAVKDLKWSGALALEAQRDGVAEIVCGDERLNLEFVSPVRLVIAMPDDRPKVTVNQRFRVEARLYDERGRALEVGKFTNFEWTPSGVLEVDNDRSSGEFGFCDTCFGMQGFRAVKPGKGEIGARLCDLQGVLTVAAAP